eukprot:scaffold27662_cov94-Skeletonema_dohrnii-CCMP3373.AAC.1
MMISNHSTMTTKLCTMSRPRFVFVFIILTLHLAGVCRAADDVVDCPGKDEAFVTTCSGTENIDSPADNAEEASHDDEPTIIDSVDFDEDDLVNEVLEDFDSQNDNNFKQEEAEEEDGVCDAAYDNTPMQQLRANINTLTKRYYDPLPSNGKAAIGAIWVLSEVMYTSGFCDEAQCVPEEARPWIGILRRTVVKQCMK